jgi:hypothetical protein
VEYNSKLQRVQRLIPTIHSMYFHGPNVTVLGEGGLQATHIVGGGGGKGFTRGTNKSVQRTGTHKPIVTNYLC